jgi:Flp pilus assembly protein TadB
MKINFERLVSRGVANFFARELKLSGMKVPVERFLEIAIIGGFGIFIAVPFILYLAGGLSAGIATIAAFGSFAIYEVLLYAVLEFKIEQRKSFVESILPDYLQLTAANVRSGIALDKGMVLAARPEFLYFSDDLKEMTKQLYSGVTLKNALIGLSESYRSLQLQHTMRMIIESIQFGGGMTDLLNQIAKDMRNQNIVQKEISGQLFMYTIFIAFATVVGAPALFALTSQMISVTDNIWAGILTQNPGGLPTAGISFLKPSAPQVSPGSYHNFALAAVILMTGLGAFIVSTISTGSVFKGLKYLPIFIIAGMVVFFIVSLVIGSIFSTISGV